MEAQYQYYLLKAGIEIAENYLTSTQAACNLLGHYPELGPGAVFTHPRLLHWRFFLLFRPYQRHILFYEISEVQ